MECCKGKAKGKHSAMVSTAVHQPTPSTAAPVVLLREGQRQDPHSHLGQHAMDRHRNRRGIGQDIAMPKTV